MGKFLSIIGGLVFSVAGVILLLAWWPLFVKALMATVPAIFIIGGLVALVGGINEVKESAGQKKEEPAKEEAPKA